MKVTTTWEVVIEIVETLAEGGNLGGMAGSEDPEGGGVRGVLTLVTEVAAPQRLPSRIDFS